MEVDTGASVSLISESTYHKTWGDQAPPLSPADIKLRTYLGENLRVLGVTTVEVHYGQRSASLPLVVVQGDALSKGMVLAC